ncbi:hypothetical protein H8E88_34950 [candidate division KSB1 bacterium]|nr:hypothetical protein [candidate division KSB1 bacterium]
MQAIKKKATRTKKSRMFLLSVVIEKNGDGFLAKVPGIQGAFAEGDTVEEAIFNCIDAVKIIADYRKEKGESTGLEIMEWTTETKMTCAVPVGVN